MVGCVPALDFTGRLLVRLVVSGMRPVSASTEYREPEPCIGIGPAGAGPASSIEMNCATSCGLSSDRTDSAASIARRKPSAYRPAWVVANRGCVSWTTRSTDGKGGRPVMA
ncbi:hypothetical protein WKW80_00925 [Variovorax humicola]|uniref:Uncharacterized protein n=1 Tax=Variovorax humicola TaxID=1769758 RepID=A0ABU8VTJ8_9BURK